MHVSNKNFIKTKQHKRLNVVKNLSKQTRNPYATTIILTPETDQLLRDHARRKGDISKIINSLITKEYSNQ